MSCTYLAHHELESILFIIYYLFLHCRGETILSDYSYIPSVVFSSPHVAKVGLDEEDAVERYGDINIFSSTFR